MAQIGVVSLGCSKNLVDSEKMMGILTEAGYVITKFPENADALIVNTCGFITPAKEESINTVLEMAEYKKSAACRCLVVTGCLPERYREELENELPEVDILIGISEYEKLPQLLSRKGILPDNEESLPLSKICAGRVLSTPKYYSYLRIADGCDNRCSYCAIPLIRGPYRSTPIDKLMYEAEALADSGTKELIVIAQDITRYGSDLDPKHSLPGLLRRLSKLDFEWIRLLYTYSDDVDDELLDVMMENDNIVKYIDIPVQHVDDDLLKRMNRRGTREDLCKLMEKIRAYDSNFVLRTSFIVGFPGETDAQFQSLLDFVNSHPFDRAGVFTYSREENTPAFDFPDQVPEEVALMRYEALMQAQKKVSEKLLNKRVGQRCKVLIDGYDNISGSVYGRSYGEAPEVDGAVLIDDSELGAEIFYRVKFGDFVDAEIIEALEHDLVAKIL